MIGKWEIGSDGKEWDGSCLLEHLPLEERLNLMTFIIIIPPVVLVIYLMATVAKFCSAHTQNMTSITQANNVTANLREDMDRSMYRIVIGIRTYQSIHELMEENRLYG